MEHTQKNQHHHYLSLLKHSNLIDPWCIVDNNLVIQEANDILLHLSKFDSIVGMHILQAFLSHTLEKELLRFINKNSIEIVNRTVIIQECKWNIEISNTQKYSYTLLVFKKHEQYSHSLECIKKSNEEEFIQNISHELRTPLTLILGYVEYLLESSNSNEFQDIFTCILQQGNRMNAVIDAFTHLYFPLHFQEKQLVEVEDINVVIEKFIHTVLHRDQKVRIQFSPFYKEVLVPLQKNLFDIVLYNLVDNALKFSDLTSHVSITVEDTVHSVKIHVIDQGIGIPEHLHEKIFKQFYRINMPSQQQKKGLGLGLAITKRGIQAMGGEIQLDSSVDKGTSVCITLPKNEKNV